MVMRSPLPSVSRRSRRVLITVVVLLLLLVGLSTTANYYTDWLWFDEVGYTEVQTTMLRTRLLLFFVFGLGMAVIVAANLIIAFRLRPAYRPMSLEQQNLERYRLALTPRFRLIVGVLAGFTGLITGIAAQGHWQTWLLFTNSKPFGVKDPQYGLDLSFYMFQYPFWRYVISVSFTAIVLAILVSIFVHYLYGGIRLQGGGSRLSPAVIGHISVLLGIFVALKAVAYFFDRYGLLFNQDGPADITGAAAVDVEWILPAKNILLWIAALCALMFFANVGLKKVLPPVMAVILLLVSAIVLGAVVPAFNQQFSIRPNERNRQAEYIARNIEATRIAYGLTDVKRESYDAKVTATSAEIRADTGTVPNIRLLDPNLVSDTYTQRAQPRGFYDFNSLLDVDRYTVEGKTGDYVVGVRELNSQKLTPSQSDWINRHTVYTHGYGFVAAPANTVDTAGLPAFVSGSFDTGSGTDGARTPFEQAVPVEEPRIYYGELIQDYSVVGKSDGPDGEFDRPGESATPGENAAEDEGNQVNNTYNGKGGVDVGSTFRRLLYAFHFRELNFLLNTDQVNENSKVLYVRDPRERVEKVAPFLTVDGDPYPAVVDGRVVWILDGYTTNNTFPYAQRETLGDATADSLTGQGTVAQPKDEINYIRNSVKATVDAYDGTINLYAFDETDPVLKAWNSAFGNIVKPKSEIPPSLAQHFRYPEDLFKVQRTVYSKYHVNQPQEFFTGEDFWNVPDDPTKDNTSAPQPPYYVMAQFPGQTSQRFQLTGVVTANQRENLSSIFSGSYDDNGEPVLSTYELPSGSQISGPNQVQPQMRNSTQARNDLTTLNSDESKVVYGNLLTLPVGGGLLNVEPVYLQGTGENAFPALARVLVAFGEKVGYGNTLREALNELFGEGAGDDVPQPPPGTENPPNNGNDPSNPAVDQAVAAIQKAIDDLRKAQQDGDFAKIGQAQQDLANAIQQFENAKKNQQPNGSPSPTPTTSPSG